MKKKNLSEEDIAMFLSNNGFYLIGRYSGYKKRIDFEDCEGYRYNLLFGDFRCKILKNKKFKPMRFSIYNPHSIFNVEKWIGENIKNYHFVSGSWIKNNDEKSLFLKCKKCLQIWNTNWSSVITGRGCPFCAGKRVGENSLFKDNPGVSNEWNYEKNNEDFSPENISYRSNKKFWWICGLGHEWIAKPNSRNSRNKTGCPFCVNFKKSKGENKIEKFMSSNNIPFESQKKFYNCKNLTFLPFDFYISSLNLCIEYQGEQHYEPVRFGGVSLDIAKSNLKKTKKNDLIKKNFCKDNNFQFLIISYWEYFNIENILKNVFNL